MATILVVGASGMTGRSLVQQLLENRHEVRVIVRTTSKLPPAILQAPLARVTEASLLELDDNELLEQIRHCDAVVSCLGHTLDFKGLFGEPRNLCTEATQRLCHAIEVSRPSTPVKFILMNTVGVGNPALAETRRGGEALLLFLLRHLLPPHRDNERAAAYLQEKIGSDNPHLQWCNVRPDSLINAGISRYEICTSPVTGIFSGRPTTRANVAHFMRALIEDAELWQKWCFTMPVIMNVDND